MTGARDSNDVRACTQSLQRLRSFRIPPATPATVGELSTSFIKTVRKVSTQTERVTDALREVVGARGMEGIAVVEIRAGVLHLKASHPTQRFTTERLIRPQGQLLDSLARAGIARIRWISASPRR